MTTTTVCASCGHDRAWHTKHNPRHIFKAAAKSPLKGKGLGQLYAVKKRANKANAHLPDEVIVTLDGEKAGRLLVVCGWTLPPEKPVWPKTRIEANLDRLVEEWKDEISAGWKLEVRDA